jgi:hypothetical protein
MDASSANTQFFKVIACEIAFREICHAAARSPKLHDLEFLTGPSRWIGQKAALKTRALQTPARVRGDPQFGSL